MRKDNNTNPYSKYSYNSGLVNSDGSAVYGMDIDYFFYEVDRGRLPELCLFCGGSESAEELEENMAVKKPKLKPCPFCGGNAKIETYKHPYGHIMYWVGCANEKCDVFPETPGYSERINAVRSWNKRAKQDE